MPAKCICVCVYVRAQALASMCETLPPQIKLFYLAIKPSRMYMRRRNTLFFCIHPVEFMIMGSNPLIFLRPTGHIPCASMNFKPLALIIVKATPVLLGL